MKKIKKFLIFTLLLLLCATMFVGCKTETIEKSDVIGTWYAEYNNGVDTYVHCLLVENDLFYKTSFKNGEVYSSSWGEYEIEENVLRCYKNDSPSWTTYTWQNGKLKNGELVFTKKS